MTLSINQKEVILDRLETLTEEQQDSVLEFIEFLRYQTHKKDEQLPKITSLMSPDEATQEYASDFGFSPSDLATTKEKNSLKLTLEIPDKLIYLAEYKSLSIEEVIIKALESYLAQDYDKIDIKKTKTWELCGSLQVANPELEYNVNGEDADQIMTNYAENIDHVLY